MTRRDATPVEWLEQDYGAWEIQPERDHDPLHGGLVSWMVIGRKGYLLPDEPTDQAVQPMFSLKPTVPTIVSGCAPCAWTYYANDENRGDPT